MKVLFLDFDGVLNNAGSFLYEHNRRKRDEKRSKQPGEKGIPGQVNETFCNVNAANLQMVLDKYKDLKIVISSTWRTMFTLEWLKAKLEEYHIDSTNVIDKTPDRKDGERGLEIKQWLDQHPEVTHYIIVDDNDWGITDVHGKDRWLETRWETGLTFHHAQLLDYMLSNAYKKKLQDAEKDKSRPEGT